MNKNLKLDVWKKIIIITIQGKFLLTNFSLRINFHKELIIFAFFFYCLAVVCLQTLQVQWLPSQHLIMALKQFEFSEVFIIW